MKLLIEISVNRHLDSNKKVSCVSCLFIVPSGRSPFDGMDNAEPIDVPFEKDWMPQSLQVAIYENLALKIKEFVKEIYPSISKSFNTSDNEHSAT